MALPCGTTGSLCSSFLPGRPVCLPVKRACAITLRGRLPIGLSAPLEASVTLLEATTPVKLPAKQCPRISALGTRCEKASISTAAPRGLAPPLQSLLAILHIAHPVAMLSCSKGSRGLFVPLRVIGIFTDTTISPSSRLRQCPDHYTIRAGRNLPDKEFPSLSLHKLSSILHEVSFRRKSLLYFYTGIYAFPAAAFAAICASRSRFEKTQPQ